MTNINISFGNRLAALTHGLRCGFAPLLVMLLLGSVVDCFGIGKSQTAHAKVAFTDSQGAVLIADAITGLPTPLALGKQLAQPLGICVGSDGEFFVTDTGCCALIGIDPTTGDQRIVSSGGILGVPFGIAAEPRGSLLVANAQNLLRIDAQSGAQTVLSAGGFFRAPLAVAVAPSGDIYVADALGSIIRVDPETGTQTFVAGAGFLKRPQGIAVVGKHLYVTDVATADGNFGIGRIIRVDKQNGQQKVLSEGNYLVGPVGIAAGEVGELIVGDPYTINENSPDLFDGGIIRIDQVTGAQSLIARGQGDFLNPRCVTVIQSSVAGQ